MTGRNHRTYEFGPFKLVPAEKQLLRDGGSVSLTPKSFDLLLVLVENAGHLVEKGELMNRVWPDSFVEEANLSVKMSELRRVLGEGANENQYIETVPRRGYRFVARVVEGLHGLEPEVDGDGSGGGESVERESRSGIGRFWPVAAAGILILAGLFYFMNIGGMRKAASEPAEPVLIRSLAVLPLENLSGDASQDYFADGMTEALITGLAKVSDLRVMSRASVMPYKVDRPGLPEIGRRLGVDGILTGSVIRSGDRVRITVQLIEAATDRNIWANSYERDLRNVLSLQDEVTRGVVGRIREGMTSPGQARSGTPTVNPEAYDHYLRGKFYLHTQTEEENEAAIAALEKAVAVDPGFAAAHAELAQAYVWKLFLFDPGDERRLAEKAFLASEKALALDPDLAVAYLARGRLLWTPANHFPHDKAIQEYRRALSLDPNLDEARNQLALVYNHVGAFDEAMHELETAVASNPGNSLARFRIGETLLFQGKYEEALSSLRGVPNQTNPALVGHQTVWALFNLGRKDEAEATLKQFIADHPDVNSSLLDSIQALMAASDGRHGDAEKHIERATGRGKGFGHFHHTSYHIACAYAQMGRPVEAIKWLETTAATGFPCYPLFLHDKNLDKLRDVPAFQAFLSKMKQQWEIHRAVVSGN